MEENPIIVIASKTLIDMCVSLGLGKISQETFVGNLEIFAQSCRAAITAEPPAIPQQLKDAIALLGEWHRAYHLCRNNMEIVDDKTVAVLAQQASV